MKCNFIHIKLKEKNNIDLNDNKILKLFKLNLGNNVYKLDNNKNRKETSNKNLEISCYKNYIKSNIGKMIYKNNGNNRQIKIFNEIFISNNKKRAKIIINNKQYELKDNLENQKHFKQIIKIKFFDCIFYLNCMFKDCESLSSIKNFQNINMNKINDISQMFFKCSSLKEISDISKWDLSNIKNMSFLFAECTFFELFQDFYKLILTGGEEIYINSLLESKTNKIHFMSDIFNSRSSIKSLPDISKWNLSNNKDISGLFCGCSSLES